MKTHLPFSLVRLIALLSLTALTGLAQPKVSVATASPASTITPGAAVTMAVSTVDSPVTYQWKRDGVILPWATSSSYTLPMVGAEDRGSYQIVVTGSGGATTVDMGSLAVTASDARMINLSARAMVGMGNDVMIAGFVSQGDASSTNKNILVRGMGPALSAMGGMMANGFLAKPVYRVQ